MIIVPPCAVATAPVDGRVRRVADVDTDVRRGEVVAEVDDGSRVTEVTAPAAGRVGGALADERQSVTAGEGVVWLSRR